MDAIRAVLLMSKIVNFLTKLSDQRERSIADRAVARIWLAAQPPCASLFHITPDQDLGYRHAIHE